MRKSGSPHRGYIRGKRLLHWGVLSIFPLYLAICGSVPFAHAELPVTEEMSAAQLNSILSESGGQWVAEDNELSRLSLEEKMKRLGALEDAPPLNPEQSANPPVTVALPSSLDWRNNGGNFVSPVRDQGSCGSCWAFASVAALESRVMSAINNPKVSVDLSEQILLSCSGAGDCDNGGYVSSASDYLVGTGTGTEICYKYTAGDGSCATACNNWESYASKLGDWQYITSGNATVSAIKNAIYTHGPVIAWFKVYKDLYSYKSGVYSYTSGSFVGNHFVLIVGWDDSTQSFIVKNSWGTKWGKKGYFNISYNEVNGTTQFGYWTYAYTVAGAGSLNVSLTPSTAASKGAFRVDGGAWKKSGVTVSSLLAGNHLIEFKDVSGLVTPASIIASVTNGSTPSVTGTYLESVTANFTGTPVVGKLPLTVTFTDATVCNTGTVASRKWSFGDGKSDTTQNPSHTYTKAGTFSVSLAVTGSTGYKSTKTRTGYITVDPNSASSGQ